VALGGGRWARAIELLALDDSLEAEGSFGTALGAVLVALIGDEHKAFGEALVHAVRHPRLEVRKRVIMAFSLLDTEPEWPRQLAQLALAEPQWTASEERSAVPNDPDWHDLDWWVARACAAIAPPLRSSADDRSRAVELLKRVALKAPGADTLIVALARLDPEWVAAHLEALSVVSPEQREVAELVLREAPGAGSDVQRAPG
jgi:hypothetical protein